MSDEIYEGADDPFVVVAHPRVWPHYIDNVITDPWQSGDDEWGDDVHE